MRVVLIQPPTPAEVYALRALLENTLAVTAAKMIGLGGTQAFMMEWVDKMAREINMAVVGDPVDDPVLGRMVAAAMRSVGMRLVVVL